MNFSCKQIFALKGGTLSIIKKVILLTLLLFLGSSKGFTQKSNYFPHSIPEKEGVSSVGIDSFLTAIAASKHEFHSLIILRHDKIIAEGWWNPYAPELKHSMYSTSKSFTSTAVGFAVSEKLLTVNDKVISFFPNDLPDKISPYLAQLTVKDLLTMSVGQEPDPTTTIPFNSINWKKAFLATGIVNKPGTKFLYNTMATFMLSAIVQKVTGQKEFDYLKPRLFDPLGIKGIDWEVNDEGINTGGWGLRLKTEDMAKLGELYLHKGIWKGKQVLPKEWAIAATTFKIDQAPDAPKSKKDSSDWMQGYCYQFWRCRHNAFRADGAFGQYIIVMPDQDAVIAITSESPNMQEELNLVWKYLLPAMQPKALAANQAAESALKQHLDNLKLAPLSSAGITNYTFNKTYNLQPNDLHFKSISINTTNNSCHIILKNDSGSYPLNFANGKWLAGFTDLQGPGLLAKAKENFSFLKPYQVDASYAWADKQTLILKLRYIESPHTETITCHFNDQKMTADVAYSYNYGKGTVTLNGDAAN